MNERFYSLFDWLSIWSLPAEPIDLDDAMQLMARKFETLCDDDDWRRYAIGKWPDEVFDLTPYLPSVDGRTMPEWMLMMQQIEQFEDQGVTGADMAKFATVTRKPAPTRRDEPEEVLFKVKP